MRNIILIFLAFGIGGCATVPPDYTSNPPYLNSPVLYQLTKDDAIILYGNDLYEVKKKMGFFFPCFKERRLTYTPDVRETNVVVWNNGTITYFAHEPGEGHWYSQSFSGDDRNRTRLAEPPRR